MTPIRISQVAVFVESYIRADVPVSIIGSPGLGKSDIIKTVAEKLNLKVIDFRLSTADPVDLSGMPFIENGRSDFLPNIAFPIVGDELPHHVDADGNKLATKYDGWLLFLDEITNASMAVQAAAYKLILDRQVGMHDMHPHVRIACAGNKMDDGAAVTGEMSTALASRLAHIEIELNVPDWLDWANDTHIDHTITSFIKFKPTCLYNFNPKVASTTFACPRTWAMADRIVKQLGINDPNLKQMLSGIIGEGAAHEYIGFTKHYAGLATFADIVADPVNAKLPAPEEISALYALSGSIAAQVDTSSMSSVVTFMERMSKEYQLATFASFSRRKPSLVTHPDLRTWVVTNSKEMNS